MGLSLLLAALAGNNWQGGGTPPAAPAASFASGESFGVGAAAVTPPVASLRSTATGSVAEGGSVYAPSGPAVREQTPEELEKEAENRRAAVREFIQSWSVEVSPLGGKAYEFQLTTWPMRGGGEGEGMMILKRRAEKMRRELGAGSFRIQEYQSGIQQSLAVSQRYIYAIVEFDAGR